VRLDDFVPSIAGEENVRIRPSELILKSSDGMNQLPRLHDQFCANLGGEEGRADVVLWKVLTDTVGLDLVVLCGTEELPSGMVIEGTMPYSVRANMPRCCSHFRRLGLPDGAPTCQPVGAVTSLPVRCGYAGPDPTSGPMHPSQG
jgi:hypothetical protein